MFFVGSLMNYDPWNGEVPLMKGKTRNSAEQIVPAHLYRAVWVSILERRVWLPLITDIALKRTDHNVVSVRIPECELHRSGGGI